MYRTIRPVLVALALLVASLAGPIPPASADHANRMVCTDGTYTCGHWGNRYSPPVYTNLGPGQILPGGASVTDVVQDAAYLWQDNGFVQGWNPGALPGYSYSACTGPTAGTAFIDGAIHVCFIQSSQAPLYGRAELTYATRFGRCDTACNHIYAATTFIAYDASPALRQYALRHGFGHALGLGHHDSECGVMSSNYCGSVAATADDRSAMWIEYGSHVSG